MIPVSDMHSIRLRRLRNQASVGAVRSVISSGRMFESEELSESIADLSEFRRKFDEHVAAGGGVLSTSSDAPLARELHEALRGLTRRELTDPLMWQWLSLGVFPDYVASRWFAGRSLSQLNEVDADGKQKISDSEVKRFLGSASLVGVSRNSLARLYWGADAAWQQGVEPDRYADVELVFELADLFVGVFERVLGLRADTALDIIRRISVFDEKSRREILSNLNLVLSTTCLEAMEIGDFEALMNDLIPLTTNVTFE